MPVEDRLTALEVKMDNLCNNDLHEIKVKLDNIDKRLWFTTMFMVILSFIAGVNAITQVLGVIR